MLGKKGNEAATLIQKHWRRHAARRQYPKLLKRHKKKQFIVMELVHSERTYCENLMFVIREVLGPSRALIPDEEMHGYLFGNIEQIHSLHSHFLQQLEGVMEYFNPHLTKLSGVLLQDLFNKEEFKQGYTKYCYNYKTTDQAIKVLVGSNPAFTEHLKTLGLVSLNLSLESYMIKPVQRLCKYGLIIGDYFRNMEKDHRDYCDIGTTSALIDKLVHETNDQVEQFLMRERLLELKSIYPSFFAKAQAKKPRMYYETKEMSVIDIIREQEERYKSLALFPNCVIMVPYKVSEEPVFANFLFARETSNGKYYQNMVQLVNAGNYSYAQFRDGKDKREFLRVLDGKVRQQEQQEFKDYIKVSILGTETRESFFSSYTVYIANIDDAGKTSTIYPRFKDLLKVQDLMLSKGMKFEPLLLSKESIISTLKSKTIEKRKLAIQEFLERVFNNCQAGETKEIEGILGVSQLGATAVLMHRMSCEVEEISVFLPNLQKVKVAISVDSKIRDLKSLISERMGMESTNQFEVFEIRNKNFNSKKLLYDGEPVKKIFDEQKEAVGSINPFRDAIDYLYARHYYLPREEEEELYKCDLARAELELSVIHSDILIYRLEEEVMLTFMCLFAMYIHLPVDNQEKVGFFIREVTQKSYKVSEEEFRVYYQEVKRMVAGEDSVGQSLPLIIIKIVSNSYLYQCLQFEVEVHHKVYAQYKKQFNSLEENVILGLHPEIVYLLCTKDRSAIAKYSYSQLSLTQTRPKSIVFQVLHSNTPLILKTQLSFEVSKLFEIYKNKP